MRRQASGLADALRQRHHTASIEHEHNRKLELADDLEHARSDARIGIDKALACLEWNPAFLKSGCKSRRKGRCKRRREATIREVHHRTVFCDHTVDETELAGDASKAFQSPARHEHHLDAAAARLGDRVAYSRVQSVIACDGAVVVQR